MSSSETTGATWRKATYSTAQGSCVEVAAIPWRKATYGNDTGSGAAGHVPGAILVRDTKDNGAGPVLRVAPADWARFTAAIKV